MPHTNWITALSSRQKFRKMFISNNVALAAAAFSSWHFLKIALTLFSEYLVLPAVLQFLWGLCIEQWVVF